MGFINFHNHSEFSFLSSLLKVDDLVNYAVFHEFKGCALTDTLSSFGFIKLNNLCRSENIKPVFGIEIIIKGINERKAYPVVLIAINNQGLENLFRLNTFIHQNYLKIQHYAVPIENLAAFKEGLAVMVESELVDNKDNPDILETVIKQYIHYFKDNFFAEVNYTGEHKIQKIKDILQIIENYDLCGIASCETRYFSKDRQAFELLNDCRRKNINKDEIASLVSCDYDYSIRNKDEFYITFKNHINLIDNSEMLFQKIETGMNTKTFRIPVLYRNSFEKINKICFARLKHIMDKEGHYQVRLKKELAILEKSKLSDFFLMIFDLVQFLKRMKIPYGFGRGASCSSLILYLLGITGIDPVKYDLLFESFMYYGKKQIPEINIEICWKKRNKAYSFLSSKYGKRNVTGIASLSRLTIRSLINDVSKSYKLKHDKLNKIKSLIPPVNSFFSENIHNEYNQVRSLIKDNYKFNELYNRDREIHDFLNIIAGIEGTISHASVHKGIVLIIPEGINKYSSQEYTAKGNVFAQLTKDDLEDSGFFKTELPGLRIISTIDETMKRAGINKIPEDDHKTFDSLAKGSTTAVFQLENNVIKELLKKIRPTSISGIADIIALYHQGPARSGLIDEYIALSNQKNENKIESGLLIYEEQVLDLINKKAGLSWERIDILKKMLFLKNNSKIIGFKDEIVQGCINNGLEPAESQKLFGMLVDFGSSVFSKAQAVAYAHYAYTCSYLKNHYPLEYYISSINNNLGLHTRINRYLMDLRFNFKEYRFQVLPIDINCSKTLFTIENRNIRCGLAFIKYIGVKLSKEIIRERNKNGEYRDLIDFYTRLKNCGLHAKSMEYLIKSGAFDKTGISRKLTVAILPDIINRYSKNQNMEDNFLFNEFKEKNDINSLAEEHIRNVNSKLYTDEMADNENDKFNMEFEATDLFINHHPLDQYLEYLKEHEFDKIENLDIIQYGSFIVYIYKIRIVKTKNGNLMAFSQASDRTGSAEVVFFPKVYGNFSNILKNDNIYLIRGKIDGEKIIADQLFLFEAIIKEPDPPRL